MLRVVLAKPGFLQRELASELSIARPTATRGLDFLQAKGLVKRREGEGDGREARIHPSKNALAIQDELNAASGAVTSKLKKTQGGAGFGDKVSKIRGVRSALE